MLGDQLFTDVWGANRAGIEAAWLKQMTPRDFIGTKVSRLGERLIMGTLKRGLNKAEATDGSGILKVPVVRQFIKFAIVGGSSTVVDLGLHALLMFYIPLEGGSLGEVSGAWLTRAAPGVFGFADAPSDAAFPIFKVFSASVAILNSFYWNRRWTFRIRGKEERYAQLRRFVIVSLIGMGLNTLIATGMNNIVPGHPKRSWAVASAIATVVVAFWNFTGQKYFAFRGAQYGSKHSSTTGDAEA
jgi:putative flippase GtrA